MTDSDCQNENHHYRMQNRGHSRSVQESMNKLMLQMMGAFAEFEQALIKERQREGIAKAKQMGKQIGRKSVLDAEKVEELKVRIAHGEAKSMLAKEYGICRQTLYSALAV